MVEVTRPKNTVIKRAERGVGAAQLGKVNSTLNIDILEGTLGNIQLRQRNIADGVILIGYVEVEVGSRNAADVSRTGGFIIIIKIELSDKPAGLEAKRINNAR